jgi:arginine utilization protein RocB
VHLGATACAEDRAASADEVGDGSEPHERFALDLVEEVLVEQALIAAADADDFMSFGDGRSDDRSGTCVHAWGVAAAAKDADSHGIVLFENDRSFWGITESTEAEATETEESHSAAFMENGILEKGELSLQRPSP